MHWQRSIVDAIAQYDPGGIVMFVPRMLRGPEFHDPPHEFVHKTRGWP